MGWSGYGIYDGDGTQTDHINFLVWAKCARQDTILDDGWLGYKTIIPKDKISIFEKNIGLILKKMPKMKRVNEFNAIQWHMLLALFVDNKLKVPQVVMDNGILATDYLCGDHAADFDNPQSRRKVLKYFIKKALKSEVI